MSELIENPKNVKLFRWSLLATVSAIALLGNSICSANAASEDGDRPTVWIELGGELNRMDGVQDRFVPPFVASVVDAGFKSPVSFEDLPPFSLGETGKITLQPEGSTWIFSASVRYGRSSGKSSHYQQTKNPSMGIGAIVPSHAIHRYAETSTTHTESHAIIDFMAGKDVGLGALGTNGASVLSGGLRFAQFRSKSSATLYADPDFYNPNTKGAQPIGPKYFHNYSASNQSAKSFNGVGPSISWDGSTSLSGTTDDGEIGIEWGLNGAVLFGRQKSRGFHRTHGKLSTGLVSFPPFFHYNTTHYTHFAAHDRSRAVVVPNLGAMAGVSFRYARAKFSMGYRADFFFGALDNGAEARKSEMLGFYGPFASISVGLGG